MNLGRLLIGYLGFGKPSQSPAHHLRHLKNVSTHLISTSSPIFIMTVQRVHWLWARAQKIRWYEEHILIGYKMQWTVRSFLHRSSIWEGRAHAGQSAGCAEYASRQAAIWNKMAANADSLFSKFNRNYKRLVK